MAPTTSSMRSSSRDSGDYGERKGQSDRLAVTKRSRKKELKLKRRKEAMRLWKLWKPFFRKMMQKEISKALHYARPESSQGNQEVRRWSTSRDQPAKYELYFAEPLPKLIFTLNEIDVHIALRDANGGKQVVTSGPLSDLWVELLVLDGKFIGDGQKSWTNEGFHNCILDARENKGSLLKGVHGELRVKLDEGYVKTAVSFTDNSAWAGRKKFILAVKVCENQEIAEKIQHGISGPIRVKDRRGEQNEKHQIPQLDDNVKYLRGIGKEYGERLVEAGIHTVKKFLQNLSMDRKKLQSILSNGSKKVPNEWKAIVENAKKCPRGPELFSYVVPGLKSVVLIFNSVYELLGVEFDGHYQELQSLSKSQQDEMENMKALAFRNLDDFKCYHKMDGDSPNPLSHSDFTSVQQSSSFSTVNLNYSEEVTGEVAQQIHHMGDAFIIPSDTEQRSYHFQTQYSGEQHLEPFKGDMPDWHTILQDMQDAEGQVAETSQGLQRNIFEDSFHANIFDMSNSVGSTNQNEANANLMENRGTFIGRSRWFKWLKKIKTVLAFQWSYSEKISREMITELLTYD